VIVDGNPGWPTLLVVVTAILVGTLLHEAIHAAAFLRIGGASRASVGMVVHWKLLTPYAWRREPISLGAYRWAALLPGLLLGVLPFLGRPLLVFRVVGRVGIFFALAASGYLLVVWLARDVPSDALVIDHSSRCGCEVVT
jgi:hypothetical protein